MDKNYKEDEEQVRRELYNRLTRLRIRYEDYKNQYPEFIEYYTNSFGWNEIMFVNDEINLFTNFIEYIKDINSKQGKEFAEVFEVYLRNIDDLIRLKQNSIYNISQLKLTYLINRKNTLSPEISISVDSAERIKPILLSGKINTNEFVNIFYQLLQEHKITTSAENLKKALIFLFRDKHGKVLKKSTLDTYLNPSKTQSRPKK